jgi:hypothetical protein
VSQLLACTESAGVIDEAAMGLANDGVGSDDQVNVV